MRYGDYDFMPEQGSVTFTKKQRTILRHYIDTDRSDQEHLGRESTVITANILSRNLSELNSIEQLLHSSTERDLVFRDRYYKRVKPADEFVSEPVAYVNARWMTRARFIALDPIPYSVATDEAMY